MSHSLGTSTISSAASSGPHTTVSVTNKLDGTRVKTTETVNPDGSKTVTVETTDIEGNRMVETSEFAACTPPRQVNMSPQGDSPSGIPVVQEEAVQGIPPSSKGQDQPSEDVFWNRRNKILAGILVLVIIGVVVAIIVVATKPESDSTAAQSTAGNSTPESTTLPPTPPPTESTPPSTPVSTSSPTESTPPPTPISTPPPTESTSPPTPVSTPSPTESTPSPTPIQTTSSPITSPPSTVQAGLYQVLWVGATDEDDLCDKPTPGMLVTCGEGIIEMVNSTNAVQCDYSGNTVMCSTSYDENDFWALVYRCIGSSEIAWTTKVSALPDTSVQCSNGGAAGTSIFIQQRCPFQDPNENVTQCDPADAVQIGEESGAMFCQTYDVCRDSSCNLSTPDVAASIPESAISNTCLFEVSNWTPPPTPDVTSSPSGSKASLYQVEWGGIVFPEGYCVEPTPGIRALCGAGGEISIVNKTDAVQCTKVGADEVSCTSTFDQDDFWALVYDCTGSSEIEWTTNVEIVPDSSVQCQNGGVSGTFIFIEQRCPFLDPDPNQIQCEPLDSLETNDSGNNLCQAVFVCEDAACNLSTPPLAASIPEDAISDTCLFAPSRLRSGVWDGAILHHDTSFLHLYPEH